MTMGDCSVAAVMVRPMYSMAAFTAGSAAKAMSRAMGAMSSAPKIVSSPAGRYFSTSGDKKPMA